MTEGVRHLGNSTHVITLGGCAVLTDPWLTEPADGLFGHRTAPAPLERDPDVVLLTHGHGDHFDPAALALLDRRATVLVPAGRLAGKVAALGFTDLRPVSAGQTLHARGLRVDVVRGRHSVAELCYRLERDGRSLFFGGDSMVTPEIEALADDRPVDLVILPGERSSLLGRRFVMTPEEAVALALRFGARAAMLSHHEYAIVRRSPLAWLVRVPDCRGEPWPRWFVVPRPGDFVPFPEPRV